METIISIVWLGVLLVICGLLYMAGAALSRRRLSGPVQTPEGEQRDTLEPSSQGVRFLGLARTWPGLALVAVGVILLLVGAVF